MQAGAQLSQGRDVEGHRVHAVGRPKLTYRTRLRPVREAGVDSRLRMRCDQGTATR